MGMVVMQWAKGTQQFILVSFMHFRSVDFRVFSLDRISPGGVPTGE
jgi:hypothetical protein